MRLLRALGELERERGWLDDAALAALAERERVPLHRLEELVSFYPHFRRTPPPRVEVGLCRDLSCHLAGAPGLHARLRADLGDAPGVELREASCLGRCDSAPAATIDGVPVRCSDVAAMARLIRDPSSKRPQAQPVQDVAGVPAGGLRQPAGLNAQTH